MIKKTTKAIQDNRYNMIASKCPICGEKLSIDKVEKLLKGGNDVAVTKVTAGVCKKCGEILYEAETANKFDEIREKLRKGDTKGLRLLGKCYAM